MGTLTHFLGGSPLGVVLRLAIFSLLVGMALTWLDMTPVDLWYWATDSFRWAWGELGQLGDYMLIGAMVVVPVFLFMRIVSWRGRPRHGPGGSGRDHLG